MSPKTTSQTLKEYGRGLIGGLLFSLPIIYTMEVWWTGFIATPKKLLVFILITFLLLLGYNNFSGMRKDTTNWEIFRDSIEEIGMGFVTVFLFLLLINRIQFGMSFQEIIGKVIVESMITSIGISIGTSQLGQQRDRNSGATNDKLSKNKLGEFMVMAICGATLVSSSVAPNDELQMIAFESSGIQLLLMIFLSLFLGAITLFYSDFRGTTKPKPHLSKMLLHLGMSYLSAIMVSTGFLWFFDRLENVNFYSAISLIVVLAIPGIIGASAGRLLLRFGKTS